MKKNKLIVANWKMNPETLTEAKSIFVGTRKAATMTKNAEVVICPPLIFLHSLLKIKRPKNMSLGVQNISGESKGAFTGEVSAGMVKNLGAYFVIVGHSERRLIGESNDFVVKKLRAAFDDGLYPVLCVGEKERNKDGGYLEFIRNQLKECLSGLRKKELIDLTIAYEPIWAIGRSYEDAMTPTDIHETTLFIKKVVGELFGRDIAGSIKILYGGAVEAENAEAIFTIGNVDGLLVGHASLSPEIFGKILATAK